VTTASVPRAPYALAPTPFPFPALAALAGQAPLGGPREAALACFMVARIVVDCVFEGTLGTDQNRARLQGVKHWLGAATLAAPTRAALQKLAESGVSGDREAARTALDSVIAVTANQLDPASRLELGRLAQAIVK
jgi:hypothetical protein